MPVASFSPVRFELVDFTSARGNAWLKLAGVNAAGEVQSADDASYFVQMRLDRVNAMLASMRPIAEGLLAAKAKLESEAAAAKPAPVSAPVSAPVADTRVDALAAKVDALTDAMTALAQVVARSTGPTVLAPETNGSAKPKAKPAPAPSAPAAPADPFADLPF
jgi:hypothetical protein